MAKQTPEQQLKSYIKATDAAIEDMQRKHGDAIGIGRDRSVADDELEYENALPTYRLYIKLCDFRDLLAKKKLAFKIARFEAKSKDFQDLNHRLSGIVEDAEGLPSSSSGSLVNLFKKLAQRGGSVAATKVAPGPVSRNDEAKPASSRSRRT